MDIKKYALVFPYSKQNANAISSLLASLDIHSILKDLIVFLPVLQSDPHRIRKQLESYPNVILALSAFSTQIPEIGDVIKKYRAEFSDKNIFVILGGPHAIGSPKSAILHGADVVCTGEGEITFGELILHFINSVEKSYLVSNNLQNVKGIAFVKNGELIKTGRTNYVDLDKYPPFSIKHSMYRPLEITRGCAWNCRFCQTRSRGIPVKHRSLNTILNYVQQTVDHFSKRRPDIRFVSPNALSYGSKDGKSVDLIEVEKLLSGIRKIIGEKGRIYFGSFPSEVRPETITPKSVELLRKYTNATKIILGGQSGSDEVLKISERGHNAEETIRATRLLIEAGFHVDVDIIFGLPGEDNKAIADTKNHIKELTDMGAVIHSHAFMPLVGTPFANMEPGIVHSEFVNLVTDLQSKKKLYGAHERQETDAKIMSDRRKKEREIV